MTGTVAIVEYDCLCASGADLAQAWHCLSRNRSGIRRIDRFDPAHASLPGVSSIAYGGQVPLSFAELAGSADALAKWCEPGYHAVKTLAARILDRIDFDVSRHDPQRIGLVGATVLTSHASRDAVARTGRADSRFILNQCQNIPLAAAASEHGLHGPCFSVNSACASSAHAVFLASQLIQAGAIDAALVVGFEFPIEPAAVGGLDWIGALYRHDEPADRAYAHPAAASRPFSRDRRGFVLAEGAGAVFLSDLDYARRMDWPVHGVIRGAAANGDADHLTRASVDNITVCIERALASARCSADDIDGVSAHATSTPVGDAAELTALHRVFGDRLARVPVVAHKSQIGHSLGAAAIVALVLTLHGMRTGVLLPTLNYAPDPALPNALIRSVATDQPHQRALVNAFGFGGTNVCLVVDRHPSRSTAL
jgi:3-oxoacyl-[acyl-carrier-protein] synthase II